MHFAYLGLGWIRPTYRDGCALLSYHHYFTSAEGSFLIKKFKSKTKLGVALRLVFQLVQHARDEKLMKSLIVYFGCGNIYI